MRVLADPWDPAYGMGFSIDEDGGSADIDLEVEGLGWSAPVSPAAPPRSRLAFVDGVRRVEMRLLVTERGRRAPGALGSFAVGGVFAGVDAGPAGVRIGRRFVTGGGLRAEDGLTVRIGAAEITWEPSSVPGEEDLDAQLAIHNEMRAAEAAFARDLAGSGADLVLVDGPLGFLDFTSCPVVGIVKRSMRRYLDGDPADLLPVLRPGERTPLFAIGNPASGSQRYSWYARVAPLRTAWHDHAGLVRAEVSAAHGVDAARRLADDVTALLPRFAGTAADPRTPQNLGPVASLERTLRHALGDERLLRRAALAAFTERERSAS